MLIKPMRDPSRRCRTRRDLFTGRWGHPLTTWDRMERDVPTLAGRLQAEGYTTGLVYDAPMFMTEGNNLDRGFGSIEWIRGQGRRAVDQRRFYRRAPGPVERTRSNRAYATIANMSRRLFETDYLGSAGRAESRLHWLRLPTTRGKTSFCGSTRGTRTSRGILRSTMSTSMIPIMKGDEPVTSVLWLYR